MKIWGAVSDAIAGWLMILRGATGWRERFALTLPGLVSALVIFFFCAFLAIALGSMAMGMPDVFGVMDALLVHAIWLGLLFAGIRLTAMAIKSPVRTLDLMVPGIYLFVGYLLVGSILNLVFPPLVLLLTLSLFYPLYRLARVATDWTTGIAVAFAAVTVLLLVAVPQALYMLSTLPT